MELTEKHKELFHYTDHFGIFGILKTQTLWATHYKFLNDSSELQLMTPELERRIYPLVHRVIHDKFANAGFKLKRAMRHDGGVVNISKRETSNLVGSFYKIAFGDRRNREALAIPYITSFCAHTDDTEYVRENGLLSQWRAYGKNGYALVFDTHELVELLKLEGSYYYYTISQIGDVVYQGFDEDIEEEFGESIDKIKIVLQEFAKTGNMDAKEIFGDVLSIFTRFKHQAFSEEREVRSIAFPMTIEIENEYKNVDPQYQAPQRPMKTIYRRQKNKKEIPYIEMFDFPEKIKLPVRKIIIGPHEDQNNAEEELKIFTEPLKIPVVQSKTPLIW